MSTNIPESSVEEIPPTYDASAIMDCDANWVMRTYARQPVVFVRGAGARLWDSEGREYLDFLAGIAVVGVGHCHPHIANAIAKQAHTLMHISNLFHNPLQATLAEMLCKRTRMERAFFCNSGAEAIETAIKIARKWGKEKRGADCHEIITFTGSFHGRTMGAVTATAQPKYQAPFTPLVPGFHYAPFNDLDAVRKLASTKTCAILLEPIQGESGVRPAAPEFLRGLRSLCDEMGILLILDEIQSGFGRTGCFLASHGYGVQPDIITLAKGIADGFPMGACLAQGEAALTLVPGDHGSTFAGQPLACAAAIATLEVLENENILDNAFEVGSYFVERLRAMQLSHPELIADVRGRGLMVGLEFAVPISKKIHAQLMQDGIITNSIGDTILRFVPPLVITREDCDIVIDALHKAMLEGAI